VSRPRLLLVPTATEVEWRIRPLLEQWADVASYDAPDIGGAPGDAASAQAIVDAGLAVVDELGWKSCVVVGDEVGAAQAIRLAAARPDAVAGLAIGHACLSLRPDGPGAPVNAEVQEALIRVGKTDFRSYVRALAQATQGGYGEDFTAEFAERVSPAGLDAYLAVLLGPDADVDLEPLLRSVPAPLLLVEHAGCLMWTRAGYEAAVAAFPESRTASMTTKPSVSPEFAELLRGFCAELGG
jgi:pimeloyl-ACP methyl ester carboxylesterase